MMESSWSSWNTYQKNAPQVDYKNQVHHILPKAETKSSALTQEAYKRGLWNVDRGSNLIRLPSTAEAYEKSPIKIKHRGYHSQWNRHVQETLKEAQDELKEKYGSLDKVPDSVLKQKLDDLEIELKDELLDTEEGKEEGWIKPQPDGTDRLSMYEKEESIA